MLDQLRQLVVPPREIRTLLYVTGVTVASTKSYIFGKRKSCPGIHRKKNNNIILEASFFFFFFYQHSVWNPEQMPWFSSIKTSLFQSFFWKFEGGELCQSSHHSFPWQLCPWVITAPPGTSLHPCPALIPFPFSLLHTLPLPTLCVATLKLACPC